MPTGGFPVQGLESSLFFPQDSARDVLTVLAEGCVVGSRDD